MKPDKNHRKHLVILYGILAILAAFISYQVYWDDSPQEVFHYWKRDLKNLLYEPEVVDLFPPENSGVLHRLEQYAKERPLSNGAVFRDRLAEALGVRVDPENPPEKILSKKYDLLRQSGSIIEKNAFTGYDGVEIIFYAIFPPDFEEKGKYPAIVMYSGHGNAGQLVFAKNSYQHAGAFELAQSGFVVYAMENRGMGELSYLGDHMRIDAVARLTGGSWYGEITTDALYLFEHVFQQPYVEKDKIGVGGVSTGGALSLFVSALDRRIAASFVQGYLGSFRTTFGTRANHHTCNNIEGLLLVGDLPDIAAQVAPRPQMFVNGTRDTFFWQDAESAFHHIREIYSGMGAADHVEFLNPSGVAHELSPQLAVDFFLKTLKHGG